MTVALDTNLLLYASDAASEFHQRALTALREYAEGSNIVYLFWPVAIGYLRIATHPSVFERPLAPDLAMANIESLIDRPNVRTPGEDDGFWKTFRDVGSDLVVRGNLVPDAHLVALMRQFGVQTIVTHDRDFRKFEAIKVKDPFK